MSDEEGYVDLDKRDKASKQKKFDSDESDNDEKTKKRMQKKLKQKQKKDQHKKDDIDINQFIKGGNAKKKEENTEETEESAPHEEEKKKTKKEKRKEREKRKKEAKDKMEKEEEHEGDAESASEEEEEKHHKGKKGKKTKEKNQKEQQHHEEKPAEIHEEDKNPDWPVEVFYCPICTVPPEYCAFFSTDLDTCKERLQVEDKDLYEEIYLGKEKDVEKESQSKKKKKKVAHKPQEFTKAAKVTIDKQKRGGKKVVSIIKGLDGYDLNMKDIAKALGKHFACGNSIVKDKETGERVIQLNGDVDDADILVELKQYRK